MNEFVKINSDDIFKEALEIVENELGETLAEGDERKLFLRGLMPILVAIKNNINYSANQNLLEYAHDENLDYIATNYHDTSRLPATEATCKGVVKLSSPQQEDILVKAGTKVTPDNITMFKIKENVVIKKGETEAEIILISVSTGEKYNGFAEGKINYIVDPIPYVSQIYNTEISKSGSDIEDDDSYRNRARLAMESKSTTGPEGAYEYWAYSADNSISGVKITSPEPGKVKILVVVDDGELPSEDIKNKVYNECSARDRRPLTDKVEVGVPTVKEYNIELTYYLDKNFPVEESQWRKSIEGKNLDYSDGAIREFIKWQQSEIGKAINSDELKYQVQNSATYEVNGRKISAVRRIIVTSPTDMEVKAEEIAKAKNISVTYGGME